jgi:tetratricopeptide (TPR) repeat protein
MRHKRILSQFRAIPGHTTTTNMVSSLRTALILVFLLACPAIVRAQGFDRVRTENGWESGRVEKITALGVTLSKSGVETKIPVAEVLSIDFFGAPDEIRPARLAANAGRYEEALEDLKGIDRNTIEREAILQEVDYWTMFCNVRLALAGQGSLARAEEQASGFYNEHRSSYHLTSAIELWGDVLLASRKYGEARTQYAKLGLAKSNYFVARSAILTGICWQREEKHAEAIKDFDRALQAAKGDAAASSQLVEATLHRAVSRAATGNVAEAIKVVKDVIAKAPDVEDSRLMSRAYNALGDCYLQSGEEKAAREAFLHVDILYTSEKPERAKALYELAKLWTKLGNPARATDARDRLRKEYPGSPWARL